MKKIWILILAAALFFTGCSEEKFPKTSTSKKEALIIKIFAEDKEAMAEFQETTKKIQVQVDAGDEAAKKEIQEWEGLFLSKLFSGDFKVYYEEIKKKKEAKK